MLRNTIFSDLVHKNESNFIVIWHHFLHVSGALKMLKTNSCVVNGKKNVSVVSQDVVYEKDGTLVEVTRGGICGSDLHYYHNGKVGNFEVKQPMILGHEVIGIIKETDSNGLKLNQRVAINPSKPCGKCKYCKEHNENQCVNMRFFGSAMYFPHVNGGFTQYKIVDSSQCVPFGEKSDERRMAFAEPLAVAIHAAKQAGNVENKNIIVSGVGPIGCLLVSALKVLGAKEIVCVDVSEKSLSLAKKMGGTKFINTVNSNLDEYKNEKGFFDIAFEVSGHPDSLKNCLSVTRAKGTIVQVGMGGDIPEFPIMQLIAKEIKLVGAFRFNEEFYTSVSWLDSNKINPLPLLSGEFPFQELETALDFASNKSLAAKVQLIFKGA